MWHVPSGSQSLDLLGHKEVVTSCLFSPDMQLIYTTSGDATVKLWDAETGAVVKTLSGHSSWVIWSCISRDGNTLVTTSRNKMLRVSYAADETRLDEASCRSGNCLAASAREQLS